MPADYHSHTPLCRHAEGDAHAYVDAALAARRVMEIFDGADLADPVMAALFDQILIYRSA